MFLEISKKNNIVIRGLLITNPLFISNLRELLDLYKQVTQLKRPDEHKPCPIIIIKEPITPT